MFDILYSDSTAGIFVGITIGSIAFMAALVVASWKIFTKAGKPGWHSLIPFLSTYDMYEIAWNGNIGILMIILLLLSIVLAATVILSAILGVVIFVLSMVFSVKLAKAFGKGTGFGIGLILLAPIFYMILAFGSARYVGPHNPGGQNIPQPARVNQQVINQTPYGNHQGVNQSTEGPSILDKIRQTPPQWLPNQAGQSASLIGTSGIHNGFRMKLSKDRACVFGRDPETCTVVFDNRASRVSRRHCQIFYVPSNQQYAIQDLGSANGTMIVRGSNRLMLQRNRSVLLRDGDRIYFPENISSFTIQIPV